MYRLLTAFLLVFIICAVSCKKDLLYWQKVQQLNSNTTDRLDNIRFINDSICIVAGGNQFLQSVILKSVDGGYTFVANSNSDAPKEMFGMGVTPGGVIYLCGVDGDVLHSGDYGNTWKFNRILNWEQYLGGNFITADTGMFVSSVLQRQGSVVRIDSNFNIIDEQVFDFGINNIYCVNATTAYLIGYGAVMKTTDQGNTWTYQNVKGDNFTAMFFNGNEIWMCGANGGIYHTWDSGNTWANFRNGNDITMPHYYLRSIVFKDEMNGWAVGDNGLVIYTNDGGNHWMQYSSFATASMHSIALCPNGDLLIAGDNGALYRVKS